MKKNGRAPKTNEAAHDVGAAVETMDAAMAPIDSSAMDMQVDPSSQTEEQTDALAPRVIDGTADVGEAEASGDEEEAKFALSPDSIIEAVLLSTDVPLPGNKLAQIVGGCDAGDVKKCVDALNRRYERVGCSFRIELIAKGYQMLTLPAYNPWISKLHKARADSRLSAAALETLAVVAYKQPVMRADIEAVRGVAVGDMLARLREVNLVKIVGRAEEIGRPMLYGTTNRFLEVFGLSSLKELPKLDPEKPHEVPALRVVEDVPEETL